MHTQRFGFRLASIFVSVFLIFSVFIFEMTASPSPARAGGGGFFQMLVISIVVAIALPYIAPTLFEATALEIGAGTAAELPGFAVSNIVKNAAGQVVSSGIGMIGSNAAAATALIEGGSAAYYLNTAGAILSGVAVGATNEVISASSGGSGSGGGGGSSGTNLNAPGQSCYSAPNACGQAYAGVLANASDGTLTCYQANAPTVVLSTTAPPDSECPAGSLVPKTTLSASPTVIDSGQSSTLTWSSTRNATSCTWAGGFANLSAAPSGSVSTGALTQTSTYQLTCTNSSGASTPANATITVLNPEVTIGAEPARVRSGTNSTITWSAKDVKSCAVSNSAGNTLASGDADADRKFSTGSPVSPVITNQTIYTITCQTNGDSIKKSVTVNIVPIFEEF